MQANLTFLDFLIYNFSLNIKQELVVSIKFNKILFQLYYASWSGFPRIVPRTSNMPLILMLSPWYVKHFQYHPMTAFEAGRSERQKRRSIFRSTKRWPLVSAFPPFSSDLIKVGLSQGHQLNYYLYCFLFCYLSELKICLLISYMSSDLKKRHLM